MKKQSQNRLNKSYACHRGPADVDDAVVVAGGCKRPREASC